jgi:hypothetical protein
MFDFGTWVYLIVVGLVIGYVGRRGGTRAA